MHCFSTSQKDKDATLLDQAVRMRDQLPRIVEPSVRSFFLWPPVKVGHVHRVVHEGKTYKLTTRSIAPALFTVPNFLTTEECDHLIKLADGRLSEAKIMLVDRTARANADFYRRTRNNTFTWIQHTDDWRVRNIADRIATLLNLPTLAVLASEALQLLHYGVGEHYYLHTDSSEHHPRFATVLFYLNNVKKGGTTAFPLADCGKGSLGTAIHPKKGLAVVFYNYSKDGNLDRNSLHAATDVIVGEKWAANQWISLQALQAVRGWGEGENGGGQFATTPVSLIGGSTSASQTPNPHPAGPMGLHGGRTPAEALASSAQLPSTNPQLPHTPSV